MDFHQGMRCALVLAVLGGVSACSGSQENLTARTALEEFTAQHPDAPVVVPVRWSDDWESFEPDMWQTDNGRITEAHFRIVPTDGTLQDAVGLCVAAPDLQEAVATHSERGGDGWRPCDLPDGVARRTMEGAEAVLYSYGDEPPGNAWSNVEFTTRWRSVDWLDDVHGGCCP